VRRDGDLRFVLVERNGAVVRRLISAGARDAEAIEVKKGLAAGERVVIGQSAGQETER
jgi:hypothetical protein